MLELYYNFLNLFFDIDKYKEIGIDIDSLCLAEQEKYCMIVYEIRRTKSGNCYVLNIVMIRPLQLLASVFPEILCWGRAWFVWGRFSTNWKVAFVKQDTLLLWVLSSKFKFSSKGLDKRTFENIGNELISGYRKMLDKKERVTSTNRRYRTKSHYVADYEETKKRSSIFILAEFWVTWNPYSTIAIMSFLYTRILWRFTESLIFVFYFWINPYIFYKESKLKMSVLLSNYLQP